MSSLLPHLWPQNLSQDLGLMQMGVTSSIHNTSLVSSWKLRLHPLSFIAAWIYIASYLRASFIPCYKIMQDSRITKITPANEEIKRAAIDKSLPLYFSFWFPHNIGQFLVQNGCSINTCWMNFFSRWWCDGNLKTSCHSSSSFSGLKKRLNFSSNWQSPGVWYCLIVPQLSHHSHSGEDMNEWVLVLKSWRWNSVAWLLA